MRSSCIVGNVGRSFSKCSKAGSFSFIQIFLFPVCHLWFWWCNWSVLKSKSLEHLFTAPNTYLSAELSRFRIYCRLFSHFSKRIQSSIDGSTSTYNEPTHPNEAPSETSFFIGTFFNLYFFCFYPGPPLLWLRLHRSVHLWNDHQGWSRKPNFPLPATLLKNIHLFSINSRCFCVFNVFTLRVRVGACASSRW